jgi:3-hydroxyisobutyrate dehydrogenase-like beta-hydroxyacid dehydrogenase
MEIGFIGLGAMGSPIAANLLKFGHRLRVWNRSPGAVDKLAQQGAERAFSPAEVFERPIVFTMLADDTAIRSTLLDTGVLRQARRETIHVVMSTISVAFAKHLEEIHREAGIAYVAAPVLGRPDLAAAGELHILVAGESPTIERIRPALDAAGKAIWPIAAEQHKANLVKLAANLTLASVIETLGEVFALARRHEIEPQRLHEILTGTLFAAPAYKTYGPLIAKQRFEPALFKLPLGLKDIRQALEAAEAVGAPLPLASLVRDNLVDAVGHGDADKDWSALAATAFRRAGL